MYFEKILRERAAEEAQQPGPQGGRPGVVRFIPGNDEVVEPTTVNRSVVELPRVGGAGLVRLQGEQRPRWARWAGMVRRIFAR